MSKRKKVPPKRVDEEKRQRLTWNMGDGHSSSSLCIIDDADPALILEQQQSEAERLDHNRVVQPHSHDTGSHQQKGVTVKASVHPDHVITKTPLEAQKIDVIPKVGKCSAESDTEPFTTLKSKEVYENYFVCQNDVNLKQSLLDCHAMVEVHSLGRSENVWQCKVGRFKVSVLQPYNIKSRYGQPVSIPKVTKFWLYGSRIPGCSVLYYELLHHDQENTTLQWNWKRNVVYYLANIELPFKILEDIHRFPRQKIFRFVDEGYSEKSSEIEVAIYLQDTGLASLQFPSEAPGRNMTQQLVQGVMSYFYGLDPPDSAYAGKKFSRKHDINTFFENIKEIHDQVPRTLRLDVQHPTLKPVLRTYQKRGVLWMLEKERFQVDEDHVTGDKESGTSVHSLFEKVTMQDGERIYYNRISGIFVKEKPKPIIPPPGGLLADEMGLGKTVEVLACMLLNPRRDLAKPEPARFVKTWVKDLAKEPTKEDIPSLASPAAETLAPQADKDEEVALKHTEVVSSSNGETSENTHQSSSPVLSTPMEVEHSTTFPEHQQAEIDPCRAISVSGPKDQIVGDEKASAVSSQDSYPDGAVEMEQNTFTASTAVVIYQEDTSSAETTSNTSKSATCSVPSSSVVKLNSSADFSGSSGGKSVSRTSALPAGRTFPSINIDNQASSKDLTEAHIAIQEHLTAQYDLSMGRLGQNSLYNAGHVEQFSSDSLTTSDGKSAASGNVSEKGQSAEFQETDESLKDTSGIAPKKVDSEVGDEDTIPYGDSMVEYDLTVVSEGVGESSQWDYWLKRKQRILERTKKCEHDGEIEVAGSGDKSSVSAQDRSYLKSVGELPVESVDVGNSAVQCVGLSCEQNDSKPSNVRTMEEGKATALCPDLQSGLDSTVQCAKTGGGQSVQLTNMQGMNSGSDSARGMSQGQKTKSTKKARSKSMPHVLVATNSFEPKTGRNKSVDSNMAVVSDPSSLECDKVVVSSEVTISVENATGKENGSNRAEPKRRTPKSKKFEYNVPVDQVPAPKKGFSQKIEKKEYFECVCGQKAADFDTKLRVQCEKCGLWQHADCVGYDVDCPDHAGYKCPHCHVISEPVRSGATLIISPGAICHQWVEEIHKHIKEEKLKVFVYGGVNKHRFIQPQTLASHDVVITTYDTLSKEVNYVDLPHSNSEKGRRLRHPKRFMAIPSPIIAVEWWRICLDEAQMVECTTTRTAEMALRLSAVNKWCVTGTPIHHDLGDLYGLLLFLGVDPYWVKHWWDVLLYRPYCFGKTEPMHQAIADVLWRTSKKDVIDQLGLPTQSEKIHWLKFSPVEEHFYRQQYEYCYKQATNMLRHWDDNHKKLSSLDRHTLHWLLRPLVNLRQACCHPQAVRGAFLNVNKSTMTMDEILTQLTKKAKNECEESHRQMVAAMNGTAAIHFIKEEYGDAVEVYRDVLRSIGDHESQIRTDKIQQLHTLHNLDEVLTLGIQGIGRTLRDDVLKQQCKDIREEYLAKAVANVVGAHEALAVVQENIQELSTEFEDGINWWADVIQYALTAGVDDVLVDRVRSELLDNSNLGRDSLALKFRNVQGMEYVLNMLLEQLEEAHDNLTISLTALDAEPTPNSVEECVICCLRPAGEIRKTCDFCKADELFSVYESKLFLFKEQGVFGNVQEDGQYSVTTKRQGTWADCELERTLKILASFTRHIAVSADTDLSKYGNVHIKMFEALKKEFKCLRSKWLYLRERVSAIDELNMATTRYRLRLPGEEPTDPPQPNVLDAAEVVTTKTKLAADKIVAEGELKKKLGQLMYLSNLEKAHDHLEGGSNPEPCPICQKELGEEWSVMRCGHFYCMDCIHIMLNDYSCGLRRKSLKCAICRRISLHSEISYVSMKQSTNTEEGDQCFQVKGDHSTKVTAVVRCLKQIQLNDPGAKALIFSTWPEVLNVITRALRQNKICFKYLHAQNKFQANLQSFRSDDDVSVLLLPVHSGANGLNLIEATHVLLVEPILNQAQELQAIGRIHRIGQTKPTYIHRFIVKATIEEKMHSMLKSIQTPIDSHNDEESNLTIGDLWSLFRRDIEEQDNEPEGVDPSPGMASPGTSGSAQQEDSDNLTQSVLVGYNQMTTLETDQQSVEEPNIDGPVPADIYQPALMIGNDQSILAVPDIGEQVTVVADSMDSDPA